VEADHRARLQASDLHQVAHLVREPKAPRAYSRSARSLSPDQRLVDSTLIADLADERARVAPNPQRAPAPTMLHAVGGYLVRCLH
jgi:hypothetical protein